MTKLSKLLVAASLVAGASFSASAAQVSESSNFYYWLHPKLGMVKVNKATNAMIKPVQANAQAAQPVADTSTRGLGASAGSPLSRAQVTHELQEFQRNPVTADGYRFINGEIGYERIL